MLEEQALRMERLRKALEEGEASGEPATFDVEEFMEEKKKRYSR
jgi:Arc/MetJ-type ribon-helix-helix transcriptional regulator